MLENNPNKINWDLLSRNQSILTYDYERMKEEQYSSGLVEELMQNRFHPRNVDKFEDWGFDSVY